MKGSLLNPWEAVPLNASFPGIDIRMSGQEASFWLWRVRSIFVEASASISGTVDDGTDKHSSSYSHAFSNIYSCLKPPFPGHSSDERDQAYTRRRYASTLGSGILYNQFEPLDGTGGNIIAFQFSLDFGENIYHDPNSSVGSDYFITFATGITITIPETEVPVAGSFSVFTPQSPANYSGSIILEATDRALGVQYSHTINGFWDSVQYTGAEYPEPGHSGSTNGAASIRITPYSYYEWRDPVTNLPTYDSGTGVLINP